MFDWFLMWISWKRIELCAFKSMQCKHNFLSEVEFLNHLFEIETINILDRATDQRFRDTTIIITSIPAQVLHLTMPMPFYKKLSWQNMTKRYHLYPWETILLGCRVNPSHQECCLKVTERHESATQSKSLVEKQIPVPYWHISIPVRGKSTSFQFQFVILPI